MNELERGLVGDSVAAVPSQIGACGRGTLCLAADYESGSRRFQLWCDFMHWRRVTDCTYLVSRP
jgi:hypothetical protein